jgi:class 3 adenylate cyclase
VSGPSGGDRKPGCGGDRNGAGVRAGVHRHQKAGRLREIMAALVDRVAVVVQRSEGTVDEFIGDGIVAMLGGRP